MVQIEAFLKVAKSFESTTVFGLLLGGLLGGVASGVGCFFQMGDGLVVSEGTVFCRQLVIEALDVSPSPCGVGSGRLAADCELVSVTIFNIVHKTVPLVAISALLGLLAPLVTLILIRIDHRQYTSLTLCSVLVPARAKLIDVMTRANLVYAAGVGDHAVCQGVATTTVNVEDAADLLVVLLGVVENLCSLLTLILKLLLVLPDLFLLLRDPALKLLVLLFEQVLSIPSF